MRGMLKLRRDAIFIQSENGIVFRTREGAFALRGRTIYDTFRKLLPHLNGTLNSDSLLNQVREENRASVGDLLSLLQQRGVLLTVDRADAESLDRHLRDAFAPQIGFIEHFADRPNSRFSEFRNKRIMLCGRGMAFAAAGTALLRNGLEHLDVMGGPDVEPIHLESEHQKQRHLPSELHCHGSSLPASYSGFDFVIYCSERPSLSDVYQLNEAARLQGTAFLPAIMYGRTSLTGPLVYPSAPACWLCAMLRWADNNSIADAAAFWRALVVTPSTLTETAEPIEIAARILGNTAAMEVFKYFTGAAAPESEGHVLEQDINTLEAAVRPLPTHPDCPYCSNRFGSPHILTPDGIGEISKSSDPSDLLTRWVPYMGHTFGIFGDYRDATIEQIPLRISAVSLSSAAEAQRTSLVFGWSINNSDDARLEALTRSIEIYAERLAARSIAHRLSEAANSSEPVVAPSQIWGWMGNCSRKEMSCAMVLASSLDGQLYRVPAGAVLASFDVEGYFDRRYGGVGAGRTMHEALERAALSLCQSQTERALTDGELLPEIWQVPNAMMEDREFSYLISACRTIGLSEPVFAIAEPQFGTSTALVLPDDATTFDIKDAVMATRFSRIAAVKDALMARLAKEQLRRTGHAPPPPRYGCTTASAKIQIFAEHQTTSPDSEGGTLDILYAKVKARGGQILFVDLTPPDIVATKTFCTAKVLICERAVMKPA